MFLCDFAEYPEWFGLKGGSYFQPLAIKELLLAGLVELEEQSGLVWPTDAGRALIDEILTAADAAQASRI
jgi:hypothetical protein